MTDGLKDRLVALAESQHGNKGSFSTPDWFLVKIKRRIRDENRLVIFELGDVTILQENLGVAHPRGVLYVAYSFRTKSTHNLLLHQFDGYR